MTFTRWHAFAPFVALLLLAGMGMELLQRPTARDAQPYHDAVLAAAWQIPLQFDGWQGRDVPQPEEAVSLLNPNALISRRYVHEETNRAVNLILVQTRDARWMTGHYPPRCYPAHGWTPESQQPRTWQVGDRQIPGMEYVYSFHTPRGTRRMWVANLLILPDGQLVRDMGTVYSAAADYTRYFYGAAQLQMVIDQRMDREERDEIYKTFIAENMALIDLIRTGIEVYATREE